MADNYTVTAPLVITKKDDGSDLYLYEGAFLPEGLADSEVKRLVDGGFVEKQSNAAKAEGKSRSGKPAAESN